MRIQNARSIPGIILAVLALLAGCKDSGTAPTEPPAASTTPVIVLVNPGTASVGDTLTIAGSNFGGSPGSSSIVVGGIASEFVVSWSDTLIRIIVPPGALTGNVVIIVGGVSSNQHSITISGTPPVQVSFRSNVLPIFSARGCISCHGGSGGLIVGTVAQLLQGGVHGPAIVAGNAASSSLIQKLSAVPPFGSRMPQGGPYLDQATIQVISDWINAGAPNN